MMHTRLQSVVDICFTKFRGLTQNHLVILLGKLTATKLMILVFALDYVPTLLNPEPGEKFEVLSCTFLHFSTSLLMFVLFESVLLQNNLELAKNKRYVICSYKSCIVNIFYTRIFILIQPHLCITLISLKKKATVIPANVSLAKKASSNNKKRKMITTATAHQTVPIDPGNENSPKKNKPYYVQ